MSGIHYYGRDGAEITFEEWGELLGDIDKRRVAATTVELPDGRSILVSTVLIGIDFAFDIDPNPEPLIFETMTFDRTVSQQIDFDEVEVRRYPSEQQALAGHDEIVRFLGDFGYEPIAHEPCVERGQHEHG